jgi:hypothetical protein
MFDMSPVSTEVKYARFQEDLAKAERHHALNRDALPVEKHSAARITIQVPRISLFRRLSHLVLRPA